MFLVKNFMINLIQFKDFIYHEQIQRNKSNIELIHEKMPKKNNSAEKHRKGFEFFDGF